MLQLLHIENIAIIERADIAFARGFNALTGETGAGKSIVIDSLGAVLGQRTSRDLIRTGAPKALVSAAFDGVDAALPALRENGVAPERTITVQTEATGYKPVVLSVDGGKAFSLRHGDAVEITRSRYDTKLVRLERRSFCEILQRKMLGGLTDSSR